MRRLNRRLMLKGSALLASVALIRPPHASAAVPVPDPMAPVPIPPQAAAKEGLAELPGARLWYWDTGGTGQAVVLLHPATGSSAIWSYQQPALAKAGYRAIAYSRRGHGKSDPVPRENPGSASVDLRNLLDFLRIAKCHVVGSAAGCQVGIDFALSNPDRLHSLTLACGVGGIQDSDYVTMADRIRPPGYDRMPAEFRELSPSYRAANPEGAAAWAALERSAVTGNRVGQTNVNRIVWATLEKLAVPVLLMGGDADLGVPPPMLRAFASHLPDAELVIVPEAGHSIYWEQPEVFNRTVLTFISRHAA